MVYRKKYYVKPVLEKVLGPDVVISRKLTGGMMNLSYLLRVKDEKYILYVPQPNSNTFVNRKLEKHHIDLVTKLGITSENIYYDLKRGIKINRFIPGWSLNNYHGSIDYQMVSDLLHRLHDSKELSPIDYMPLSRLSFLESIYLKKGRETNDYKFLKDYFCSNLKYLDSKEKVLCHNDFQLSNIIFSTDLNYYLIDFEFMGNNDPLYDIACFGNNSLDDMDKLMKEYRPAADYRDYRRLYLWRIFVSLQWSIMALIKHSNGEDEKSGFDFVKVSEYFIKNAYEAKAKFEKLF